MRDRRRVMLALLAVTVVGLAGGVLAAWLSRNDTICRDRLQPVSVRDLGLDRKEYRCHDGEIVTK